MAVAGASVYPLLTPFDRGVGIPQSARNDRSDEKIAFKKNAYSEA